MKIAESKAGIAKIIKLIDILSPIPIITPPANGPKTPPNLPAPIAHPIPVVLYSVGYNLAATA